MWCLYYHYAPTVISSLFAGGAVCPQKCQSPFLSGLSHGMIADAFLSVRGSDVKTRGMTLELMVVRGLLTSFLMEKRKRALVFQKLDL